MNESKIVELVNKYVSMGNRLFNRYPTVQSITFFDNSTVAGRYQSSMGMHFLKFNSALAKHVGNDFEVTVAHEVAHLFSKILYPNMKQSHGREFRTVMQAFGHTPRTYHNYDVSVIKTKRKSTKVYEVRCNCKSHMVTKYKAMNISGYKCKLCSGKLELIGKKE